MLHDRPDDSDEDMNERREMRVAWKEEQSEFNRLRRLALALGVDEVIVSPASVSPDLQGLYKDAWTTGHSKDGWGPTTDEFELAREWGLPERKIRSLNRKCAVVILINFWFENACGTLAHEIGHHIEALAGLTVKERNAPITVRMCRLFSNDSTVHENRSEINAECFAFYLTSPVLKKGVRRHCVEILLRVRSRNRKAYTLIRSHRNSLRN